MFFLSLALFFFPSPDLRKAFHIVTFIERTLAFSRLSTLTSDIFDSIQFEYLSVIFGFHLFVKPFQWCGELKCFRSIYSCCCCCRCCCCFFHSILYHTFSSFQPCRLLHNWDSGLLDVRKKKNLKQRTFRLLSFFFYFYSVSLLVRISIELKCMLYSTENEKKQINTHPHTHLYIFTHVHGLNPIHFRDYFFSLSLDSLICHSVVCFAKVFA